MSDLSQKMDEIERLEEYIQQLVDSLKNELSSQISSQRMKGVTVINDGKNGGPLIGVVRLSTLQSQRSWSPEFYFPQKQAEAVSKRLASCKTVKQIIGAVEDMLNLRAVKMSSSSSSDKILLNDETVRIIAESELGQYCRAHGGV